MSHYCKALIIHCIDFRFGKAIKKYLEDENLLGDVDIVSVAGAVKNLVDPKEQGDVEFMTRQVEISSRLHQISQVILMNHTDCGAYGGSEAFENKNAEYEKHTNDIQKAKEIIIAKFPNLEVKKILAHISPEGQISFEGVN